MNTWRWFGCNKSGCHGDGMPECELQFSRAEGLVMGNVFNVWRFRGVNLRVVCVLVCSFSSSTSVQNLTQFALSCPQFFPSFPSRHPERRTEAS